MNLCSATSIISPLITQHIHAAAASAERSRPVAPSWPVFFCPPLPTHPPVSTLGHLPRSAARVAAGHRAEHERGKGAPLRLLTRAGAHSSWIRAPFGLLKHFNCFTTNLITNDWGGGSNRESWLLSGRTSLSCRAFCVCPWTRFDSCTAVLRLLQGRAGARWETSAILDQPKPIIQNSTPCLKAQIQS